TNLNFKPQIEQIEMKLNISIGVIRRLRRQANLMFKLLINAYVYSYFDESSIIWGFDNSFLVQAQVNISKLICDFFYPRQRRVKGSNFRHCVFNRLSTPEMNNLLEKCNVLKITERVNLFAVQFIFKIIFLKVNVPYLQNLFVIKECEKSSKTVGMLTVRNAENSTFSRSI